MDKQFGRYGLPLDVRYCRRCTISNQRPSSAIEFTQRRNDRKSFIGFDEDGVCTACRYAEKKRLIDWKLRERELEELCNRFRRTDGRYDVLVPGSGGKDSIVTAHMLKYRYDMHPVLLTWPPNLYTIPGKRNFDAWLMDGFANYTYYPNQKAHRLLTRLAFENLCHPFQPFILGQKNVAPRLSAMFDIPLIMYGENEAEYGNPIHDNEKPTRDPKYYAAEKRMDDIYLAGICARDLMKEYGFAAADLAAYLPANPYELEKTGTEVHYMGYYIKWHPQNAYYYAVENTDFLPNDFRTEGSYSKYNSIDDKIDWLHFYTYHLKFGIGRATYDSAQEIRNGDISREEGIALVKRFDGEYPHQYLNDCLNYMGITEQRFADVIEEFRTPHLWEKGNGAWQPAHPIWKEAEKEKAGQKKRVQP